MNIFQLALFAGTSFIVTLGSVPAASHFSALVFIPYMQATIVTYTAVMRLLMMGSLIPFIVLLMLTKDRKSTSFALTVLSFLCFLGGAIVTVKGNFPINDAILTWSAQQPPADWMDVREKWNAWNLIRTLFSQVGLACGIASLLCMPPYAPGTGNLPQQETRRATVS